MNNKKSAYLTLILILTFALGSTVHAKSEPKVAIAWNNLPDSYSITSIYASLEEAGADYEVLDMAQSYDLAYDDEDRLTDSKDENGILTKEAAKLVKTNTWINSNAAELMEDFDCIIFPGGSDISPTLYYEEQEWNGLEENKDFCAERDVSDYILLSYCLEHDIPVLCICRGMQMLSVVSGADMIQDLGLYFDELGAKYNNEHRDPEKKDLVPHSVKISSEDSIIYDIFGTLDLTGCPSWHHQAVKDVSNTRLVVTAQTDTVGVPVIEAVERPDQSFCIGLQFHPEVAVRKHIDKEANAGEFMDYDTAMAPFYALIEAGEGRLIMSPAA